MRTKQFVGPVINFARSHILRRGRASDFSLELATHSHFTVNPKTMHDPSLTIPDATLVRVDEVIK